MVEQEEMANLLIVYYFIIIQIIKQIWYEWIIKYLVSYGLKYRDDSVNEKI